MKADTYPLAEAGASPAGVLYYFGDPMCSWCWGFKPVLERVVEEYPELQRVTVMGGLRRGPKTPMDDSLIGLIRLAWWRIEETTGQRFNHSFWEAHRPLATTLPACRAVVTARMLDPEREWPFMVEMFRAYFTQATDPSLRETHLEVAHRVGLDVERFSEIFDSAKIEAALQKDLARAESLGIRGFPTTVLKVKQRYHLVSPGYQSIEGMRRAINKVYAANQIEWQRPENGLYS